MKALVGYTGFVGQNLWSSGEFDKGYNTKNIEEAFGTRPDLLVYAGVRAEKFLANNDPEKDRAQTEEAFDNIRKIGPKELVLISTIDIFKDPNGKDEASAVDTDGLNAYGANRYSLELSVREEYPEALIIRLPGLFGKGLKKNFIFDYMTLIPSMLRYEKYEELSKKDGSLNDFYIRQDNGFYKVGPLSDDERETLKEKFRKLGFTALNFTDSRSRYQFYSLSRLASDIDILRKNGIKLFHPATEPVYASEIYEALSGESFVNELSAKPADYDYRTLFGKIFGADGGYIMDKKAVIAAVVDYVNQNTPAPKYA